MAYTIGKASQNLQQNKPAPVAGTEVATPQTGGYFVGKAAQSGGMPVAKSEKERSTLGKVAEFLAPTATHTVDKLRAGEDLTGRDVLGTALEVGSYFIPAGGIAKGMGLAGKGALTLAEKAAMGAATGAATGATYRAGQAIGEGEDIGGVAKEALKGGAVGGIAGAAIPVAISGVSRGIDKARGAFASRAAEKTAKAVEEKALLKTGLPDARVAQKTLTKTGQVVEDKVAKEAIRQGIPEADVALIKTGTTADRVKMQKMLEVRQSQLVNKRVTNRATDVVGDTFIEKVAKPIEATNKEAGKQLEQVARRLAGKKADPSPAVKVFADELERSGITVRKNGTLNFKGSDFEGLKGVQSSIKSVWDRALRVARTGDAHQMHRTKSFIDNMVEYGAEGTGLQGKAERILKVFRHSLDEVLDTKFPAYNRVNTTFAETIGELNKIGEAMGRRFKIGESFSDARSGQVIRRILSNTQSRSEVLKLLETSQNIARKYGAKIDEDIITQANFADLLEKMLGSEAPTSFLGQIERGVGGIEQAVSAGSEFAQGNIAKGSIKAGKYVIDRLKNVSQENKMNALRELIKVTEKVESRVLTPKIATVFGRGQKVLKTLEKPTEGKIYYHGTTPENKVSLLKSGINTKLNTKGYAEQPAAFYAGDIKEAGMYGKEMVGVRVKKGQTPKVLDISSQEWADVAGKSRNSSETAQAFEELKKRGYDAVNHGDELEILNASKFEVFDPKKNIKKP